MAPTTDPTPSGSPARRLAWLLVGVLLGLSLLMWLPRGRPEAPAAAQGAAADPAGTSAATADHAGAPAADPRVQALAPRRPVPMNRANLAIELGEDLHALATELLPLAEAGDAEAQFSLHRIIDTCEYELQRFADEAALEARRAELMARTAGIQGPAAAALDEERFRMCDGFRRDPLERFGDDDEWFRRALAQDHPLAGALAALSPEREPGFEAGRDPPEALRERARERFLGGLRSGRPEVLWEGFALDSGELLGGQWSPTPEAVAWLLLACARGLECSRAARWRREQEAFGGQPPYDDWADALLFDLPLHEREAALARAAVLAAALDGGDLEAMLPSDLREPAP